MTLSNKTTASASFGAAHAIFTKASLARLCALSYVDKEAAEELIGPLFESMLTAPAISVNDAATKAEAIIAEYG